MANSRTKILIPMLALCILAVSAYGQAVLTLGSNPTRVRSEGITEVVGLITLSNNTNAAQVIPGGTTIAIVFDGTITNDPGISTVAVGTAPDKNVYSTGTSATGNSSGALTGSGMTIVRSGASITLTVPATFANNGTGVCAAGTAPATATTFCLIPGGSLNIQGVRVNVSGLSGNIFATVTTTPANAITFPGGNNATVVGRAQATLGAVAGSSSTQAQCGIPPAPSTAQLAALYTTGGGIAAYPATTPAYVAGQVFGLTVSEPTTFPTAFSAATNGGGAAGVSAAWDEDGITPSPGFQGAVAKVAKGVQLVIALTGLPSGVNVIAPAGLTMAVSTSAPVNSGQTWTQQSPTPTTAVTLSAAQAVATAAANVLTASGGAVTVTYEFITAPSASPTTVDSVVFNFLFTAPAGTVVPVGALGAANVSVGPVSSTTGYSTTAGTLRFVTNPGLNVASIGTINPCLTNLLFPFVSNNTKTTFNTGWAISNTASDSGTTKGETGGVTAYFYGISAPTGGSAGIALPITATSSGGTTLTAGVIAPGEHSVWALNDGTTKAIAPGFQGYIVALCQFRYAHGMATIFDGFGVGAANVGYSALALVMNGTTTGRTGTNNVLGTPDSLGH